MTGLRSHQLGELVARLWFRRPDRQRGRPWALSFPDRVLLACIHWRTNLHVRQLAVVFSVSKSTCDRVISDLGPHVAALLGPPPTDKRETWVVDGTLIPVRDRKGTAKSKNYRRSVNVQVVGRVRDRRVVAIGRAWPGNRNDVVVYRETVRELCRGHPPSRVIADGAYRGEASVTSPRRGPTGRIVGDRNYRRFRRRRARGEHVICGLTGWAILKEIRHRGDRVDTTTSAVAALYNLTIDLPA